MIMANPGKHAKSVPLLDFFLPDPSEQETNKNMEHLVKLARDLIGPGPSKGSFKRFS